MATPSEKSLRRKMQRAERKRNNLCTNCGKPLDRPGALCISCTEKYLVYQSESREYYIAAGICPLCRKNEIYNNERSCPECRAKAAVRDQKRVKEKVAYNRSKYNERLEQGKCPRCGKPKAPDGFSWCEDCRAKRNKWLNRKGKKNIKAERISQGLCPHCGSPDLVPGKKMCAEHYRIAVAGAKKGRENRREGYNDTWKKTNMKMRGRFRRIPKQ